MPKTAGIILVGNEILSGKIAGRQRRLPLPRAARARRGRAPASPSSPTRSSSSPRRSPTFSRKFDVVFTSGGVGPTHDDVTIEGVARAMGAPVVRHPLLVELLERYYRGKVTEAALRMAEIPEGAELVGGETRALSRRSSCATSTCCPACPRSSARSSRPCASGSATSRSTCRNVFVTIGEGTLADYLNRLLARLPAAAARLVSRSSPIPSTR